MALGLIQESGPMAKPNLQDVSGRQKRVAIPGAGLSGLTIANELERAGYDVTANG